MNCEAFTPMRVSLNVSSCLKAICFCQIVDQLKMLKNFSKWHQCNSCISFRIMKYSKRHLSSLWYHSVSPDQSLLVIVVYYRHNSQLIVLVRIIVHHIRRLSNYNSLLLCLQHAQEEYIRLKKWRSFYIIFNFMQKKEMFGSLPLNVHEMFRGLTIQKSPFNFQAVQDHVFLERLLANKIDFLCITLTSQTLGNKLIHFPLLKKKQPTQISALLQCYIFSCFLKPQGFELIAQSFS